jgi:hypothetical protein
VTTSTRFISNCGNWLTSTTPVTLAGVTRCPSSSVNVRMVPRLRRLNELNPCIPLLVLLAKVVRPVLPWSAGNCAMASNRLGSATFSISALDSTVVGVGCVNPAEVIRDPVTTTASRDSLAESSWLPGCGTSAAAAHSGPADRTNNDA